MAKVIRMSAAEARTISEIKLEPHHGESESENDLAR